MVSVLLYAIFRNPKSSSIIIYRYCRNFVLKIFLFRAKPTSDSIFLHMWRHRRSAQWSVSAVAPSSETVKNRRNFASSWVNRVWSPIVLVNFPNSKSFVVISTHFHHSENGKSGSVRNSRLHECRESAVPDLCETWNQRGIFLQSGITIRSRKSLDLWRRHSQAIGREISSQFYSF